MDRPTEGFEEHPSPSLAREIDFRPLLLPACAFITGIVLHEYLPTFTPAAAAAACVFTLAAFLVYFLTRRKPVLHVLAILLCLACGYLRHAWRQEVLAPDDVSRLVPAEGAFLRVRGVISTRPQYLEAMADDTFRSRDFIRTRFHLDVDEVETNEGWRRASGTVQVSVYDRADDFACGDRIEIFSRFTRPEAPTSPGQFDYRKYLRRQGIRLRTGLEKRDALGRVLEYHHGSFLLEVAHGIGTRLARILDRYHSAREGGLLRCILLGERDAVDQETEDTFRLSGLSHLLTVSGLHVAVLMGGLWLGMRFFLVPERTAACVVIAAAVLYAAMASFQPSVVRAVVVTVVFALGVLINRRHDMTNTLAASALILLVVNPDDVFFAGFQLSFVSVLALVGLTPGLYRFLAPKITFTGIDLLPGAHSPIRLWLNRGFVATLALTAAAWIASQPLVAFHFLVLNPITLGLNLLIMPVFGVILLAGFLVLIVETVFGGFLVAWISNALVGVLMTLSQAGSRLPGAWVNFPSPPVWALCVFYALLLLTAAAPALGLRRRLPVIAVLAFLCALVAASLVPQNPPTPELTILDVGQGSCVLIRSTDGRSALVDIGSQSFAETSRWTVIPYLVRSRVPALDVVILSHADTDHTNGLPRLVENFGVKKVLLSKDFHCSHAGLRVERWLLDHGVPYAFVGKGDVLELGDVRLEVIHPPSDQALLSRWSSNGRSAVVRGVTPGGRFILFADVAEAGLWHLAGTVDLQADVVLAPHHGGQSGMEKLAADLHWPLLLFSAERDFIRSEHLEAYRRSGAKTFATCDDGTITVRFGEKISVESSRRSQRDRP